MTEAEAQAKDAHFAITGGPCLALFETWATVIEELR
jgi:hypothetical protein